MKIDQHDCFVSEPTDGLRLAQVLSQRENRSVGPSTTTSVTPASLVPHNILHELT
jgi:hypothetical protein